MLKVKRTKSIHIAILVIISKPVTVSTSVSTALQTVSPRAMSAVKKKLELW